MLKAVTDYNGNIHTIKIDSDLDWLAPYITKAKKLGVPVWRIKEIKGYYVPDGKQEQQVAATIKSGNKKVTITILKWHQIWSKSSGGKFEVCGWVAADANHYFEDTLEAFAHELSHLIHWEHTADRYVYEKKLQLGFAYLAKKRGYQGYGYSGC